LLQSWGGDIKVLRTEPGQGTTFSVCLPCPQSQAESDSQLGALREQTPRSSPETELVHRSETEAGSTILVVDDADNWRSTLVRLLEGRGHEVYSAASYEEAVALLRRHPIDVAVLDIRLIDCDEQNQDGLRLARQVVALYPQATTILLTGFDVPAQVAKMKAQGTILEIIRKRQEKADFDAALLAALTKSSAYSGLH
jgi:ActR/RegA family two-component response regulator